MTRSRELMTEAASRVSDALGTIADADPAAPTPCSDFTLEQLVEHVLGTTTMLAGTGRREQPADPPAVSEQLPAQLIGAITEVAQIWSEPQAWEGEVEMGSGSMPAAMIGDMVFAEILLHGWDLSRATGVELDVDAELGAELRRGVEETAELGRTMGAYGEEVAVEEDASDFDHALGAAGRDPSWRA